MRERTAQLLLLCGGLIVSCLLAEAVFYLLNRAAATYPVVVYATDKPGTELWCYDDKFQGKADWDLRLGHPYRELSYRSNMDFDSTLVALDPLAVPMAINVALNFDEFRARPLPLIKAGAAGEGLTLVVGDSFCSARACGARIVFPSSSKRGCDATEGRRPWPICASAEPI